MAPGRIRLFDEADEAQADAALRDAAGPDAVLVRATPALLRGTILDNLTLFDPARTDAALTLAGRIGLDRMVGRLARGFHTPVGETGRGPLPPGGVKRVALVAACLQQPRVLLLERPEMGLDAAGVEALAAILRDLAAQGSAIGLSTHAPALRALAEEPAA
jgi:ABC-type protease/lipase transport system fused ATPase/permease subunit